MNMKKYVWAMAMVSLPLFGAESAAKRVERRVGDSFESYEKRLSQQVLIASTRHTKGILAGKFDSILVGTSGIESFGSQAFQREQFEKLKREYEAQEEQAE